MWRMRTLAGLGWGRVCGGNRVVELRLARCRKSQAAQRDPVRLEKRAWVGGLLRQRDHEGPRIATARVRSGIGGGAAQTLDAEDQVC